MNKLYALILLLLIPLTTHGAIVEGHETDSLRQTSGEKASFFAIPPAQARFHNVTMTTRALGIGGILLGEDYLSPLSYGGTHFTLLSQSLRLGYRRAEGETIASGSLFAYRPRTTDYRWLHHSLFTLGYARSTNPAGNANIYNLELRYSRSLLRRLGGGSWGNLALGGGIGAHASGLYSTRNGNNPGTLHAALGLDLSLLYSYRFGSDRFPLLVKAFAEMRLAGAAFAQEFGESYYELYYYTPLRNRIYFVHPFNAPTGQLYTSIDLPLLDYCTLSLGYRLGLERRELNHLRSYRTTQSLMIGLSTTLLPLSGRRINQDTHPTLPL